LIRRHPDILPLLERIGLSGLNAEEALDEELDPARRAPPRVKMSRRSATRRAPGETFSTPGRRPMTLAENSSSEAVSGCARGHLAGTGPSAVTRMKRPWGRWLQFYGAAVSFGIIIGLSNRQAPVRDAVDVALGFTVLLAVIAPLFALTLRSGGGVVRWSRMPLFYAALLPWGGTCCLVARLAWGWR
jgi:hypothetical protein